MIKDVIGSIGIYPDSENNLFVSLNKGDDGVPIEKLLPPEMCGEAFKNAPIQKYFQTADMWLSDFSQLQKMLDDGRINQDGGIVIDPPFNLTKLGLILPDGSVDKERTIRLFQIIQKCWQLPMQPGLIPKLTTLGWDLDLVEDIVMKIARNVDLNLPNIRHDIVYQLLIPPECRSGEKLIHKDDLDKTLRWYIQSEDSDSIEGYLLNRAGFTELGLHKDGALNIQMCRKASEYVWSHRDEEPDFCKLKNYLTQFKEKLITHPAPKKRLPKSALQKLKKMKRKRGRLKK